MCWDCLKKITPKQGVIIAVVILLIIVGLVLWTRRSDRLISHIAECFENPMLQINDTVKSKFVDPGLKFMGFSV